jgi:RmlD substrate binding domain
MLSRDLHRVSDHDDQKTAELPHLEPDFADAVAVRAVPAHCRLGVVVNYAACDAEPNEYAALDATEHASVSLATECAARGIMLAQLSTDRVFDGCPRRLNGRTILPRRIPSWVQRAHRRPGVFRVLSSQFPDSCHEGIEVELERVLAPSAQPSVQARYCHMSGRHKISGIPTPPHRSCHASKHLRLGINLR